jgi:3'-phosphoadenosine 5'-phosphosulfate sulfotransferase (PAPS reductase)/FAD synthetase
MNPYFCKDETVLSFSGGRTSAYMLHKTLEAHGGTLPEYVKVCFANTGKEMPQTLDFVKSCADNWNVDIVWLERYAETASEDSKNKYKYTTKVVDYQTASRNGEPFSALIKAKRYMPNPVARFCTADLKIRAISDYLVDACGFSKPWIGMIGIRHDEPSRIAKMSGTIESGQERYFPLNIDKVTAKVVGEFWSQNNFDLQLPNNNGVTDWGNCDLCFLKGASKKLSIIRDAPSLADWWIAEEASLSEVIGKGAFFRSDQPSYKTMQVIATDQGNFDFFEDEDDSIACYCGQ